MLKTTIEIWVGEKKKQFKKKRENGMEVQGSNMFQKGENS